MIKRYKLKTPIKIDDTFDRHLNFAFYNGGYVAGGLAHLIASNYSFENDVAFLPRTFDNLVFNQFKKKLGGYLYYDSNNSWGWGSSGDADVFIPNLNGFEQFLKHLLADSACTEKPTLFPYTRNFAINSSLINLQAIYCKERNVDEQLNGFDIANAMVAFDNNYFYCHEQYQRHRGETLHIVNWKDHPTKTLQRLFKWTKKHRIKTLSEETSSKLGNLVIDAIEKIQQEGEPFVPGNSKQGHIIRDKNGLYDISTIEVINSIKPLLPQLTNEQLILMMSVIPEAADRNAYTFIENPIDILASRMEKKISLGNVG